jgi:hypothetical protein
MDQSMWFWYAIVAGLSTWALRFADSRLGIFAAGAVAAWAAWRTALAVDERRRKKS